MTALERNSLLNCGLQTVNCILNIDCPQKETTGSTLVWLRKVFEKQFDKHNEMKNISHIMTSIWKFHYVLNSLHLIVLFNRFSNTFLGSNITRKCPLNRWVYKARQDRYCNTKKHFTSRS